MLNLNEAAAPVLLVRDTNGNYITAPKCAILEAARNVIQSKLVKGEAFTSPEAVKEFLVMKLGGFEHEVFSIILMDNQHKVISYLEMFRGTVNSATVHPREIVKTALAANASAVIISHNHPSGFPEPSGSDRAITKRLKDALELVDIRVLDHIIVAGLESVSFAERGII